MKKFFRSLLVLLVIALVAQYGLYSILKVVLDRKSQFRLSRFFRSPQHTHYVLGNSRAMQGVNEKYARDVLKVDLINLAFNGAPYSNMLDFFNEVNSRNQNVVIFFELSSVFTTVKSDDAYSFYMDNSPLIYDRYAGKMVRWVPLLRMNNELFLRNLFFLRKSDYGYGSHNIVSPNLIASMATDRPSYLFGDKKESLARLDALQTLANQRGNRLIFFLAPYYPLHLKSIVDYAEVLQYLEENKGKFTFVDLNTMALDDRMFADRYHTNVNGAGLITARLLEFSEQARNP